MNLIRRFDHRAMMYVQSNMQRPMLDKMMPKITRLGNGGLIWIAIAVCMFVSSTYRIFGMLIIASMALGVLVTSLVLKPIVCRERPCDAFMIPILIKRPADYSFPSGHSLSSFAAATVLYRVSPLLGLIAFGLAGLIAFSRLYLCVHYPSDIAAGILIGVAVSSFARFL